MLFFDPKDRDAEKRMEMSIRDISEAPTNIFNPTDPGNCISKAEIQNESIAAVIEEAGGDTSDMSTFQYYSRIKYFEDKAKKVKEMYKK